MLLLPFLLPGQTNVDRLGRAIEAAEEEVEAALRRNTDVHKSQLRHRELEIAELQRVVADRESSADELRSTLVATKRGYEQRVTQLESLLSSRDAEVCCWYCKCSSMLVTSMAANMQLQSNVSVVHCMHQ